MKFPTASDREILKIIGNLVYYRFINSAICSPDAYDVIDLKAGNTLDSEQRKNLACIAKHLQLISMSKGVRINHFKITLKSLMPNIFKFSLLLNLYWID